LSDICNEFDIDEDEAEEIMEEFEDEISNYYYSVDDSDVLTDLCRNTWSLPVRVTLNSNYDCINSHWYNTSNGGGYEYKNSYFGDMVDVLNLNPAKVKKMLNAKGYNTFGAYPNLKYRNGKEYVKYDEFFVELENSICGANNLVFVGLLDVESLVKNNFELTEVTIPKGNYCGLFSSFQGGGSVIEMELQRDFKVKLNKPRPRKTDYDYFSLEIDETNGYSIDSVYGVARCFWGDELKV